MRKILIIMLMCLPIVATAQKKAKKKANEQTAEWRYEIEPVTVGNTGTAVIKVWSFSKNPNVAAEQCKKNAVHGVIFKGIPNKDRIQGKKPLVGSAADEATHADFFKDFFKDGGDYMRFVTLTNSTGDVLKTDKKEYKVGMNVTVNYSDLRSYLENQNVVRKLGSGF